MGFFQIEGKDILTQYPIVTKEEFQKVQEMMDSKSASINNKGRRGKKVSKDVWCRKLICECGHTYNRVVWHLG